MLQVLLVAAGYVTSIPPELHLFSKVLLGLYTVYIGFSLVCLAMLWHRRRDTD